MERLKSNFRSCMKIWSDFMGQMEQVGANYTSPYWNNRAGSAIDYYIKNYDEIGEIYIIKLDKYCDNVIEAITPFVTMSMPRTAEAQYRFLADIREAIKKVPFPEPHPNKKFKELGQDIVNTNFSLRYTHYNQNQGDRSYDNWSDQIPNMIIHRIQCYSTALYELMRLKHEEAREREEEQKRQEEQQRKREEEQKRQEEQQRKRGEDQRRKGEETYKKMQEDRKRNQDEYRRRQEERKMREDSVPMMSSTSSSSSHASASAPLLNCPSYLQTPRRCNSKKDFIKQALIFHPDKNSGCIDDATEKFKQLQNICSSVLKGGRKKNIKKIMKKNIKKTIKRRKKNTKNKTKKRRYNYTRKR